MIKQLIEMIMGGMEVTRMGLQRAAVFGGAGKIGQHVIPLLEREGLQVQALEHTTHVPGTRTIRIQGSVTDSRVVREVVRGTDVVVYMATAKEDPKLFFNTSLRGLLNVLEACRTEQVRQFILIGGDAAFGIWFYPQPIPIDENHPLTAYPGYYAFSKVMEEVMGSQYSVQYGLPITILRSSWVFEGTDILNHFSLLKNMKPTESGHGYGVIPEDALALLQAGHDRIPVLKDAAGTPLRRHIVHINDLMQGFELALGNPVALGQSFNIAGPAAFSYDVAGAYLSAATGIPTLDLICPDYHSFEINITKSRTQLGYTPVYDVFHMIDIALGR